MKITTIRLPDEEYDALREEALARDEELGVYLRRLLLQRERPSQSSTDGSDADRRQEQRKRAARAVLEFLREQGEATPADIRAHVEPTAPIDGASADAWWDSAARPAIDRARDAGLVEFVEGYDVYWWVGDEPTADSTDDAPAKTPITDALAGRSVDVDSILGGEGAPLQARREALEASLHSIAVAGPMGRTELRERIYPHYTAGHETATDWCTESIVPALDALQRSSDLLTREGDRWQLSDSADPRTLIRTAENTYRYR